jgi:hypothetical protein
VVGLKQSGLHRSGCFSQVQERHRQRGLEHHYFAKWFIWILNLNFPLRKTRTGPRRSARQRLSIAQK